MVNTNLKINFKYKSRIDFNFKNLGSKLITSWRCKVGPKKRKSVLDISFLYIKL